MGYKMSLISGIQNFTRLVCISYSFIENFVGQCIYLKVNESKIIFLTLYVDFFFFFACLEAVILVCYI
jgi:hypothetical protein